MNYSYKKLISEYSDPSSYLFERISTQIDSIRIRRDRMRISIHGVIGIGALISLIPIVRYVSSEAVRSGFMSYVSLFMTDGAYLVNTWKEMSMSMLESAPITGIALTLGAILILINSLRRSIPYILYYERPLRV